MILAQKDPSDVIDYVIDWSGVLGADTISTSTWSIPAGITQNSESETTTTATIWLSGGTSGTDYPIVNTIVTAGGRTWSRTFVVPVRDL
jgi:hypothetical protein